jgi:hypothetical protein
MLRGYNLFNGWRQKAARKRGFFIDSTRRVAPFAYWHSSDISVLKPFLAEWRAYFSDFQVLSDACIVRLLDGTFPSYAGLFGRIRLPSTKSDIARLAYLYEFGGFYVDCHCGLRDPEALRALFKKLEDFELVLWEQSYIKYPRAPDRMRPIAGVMLARPRSQIIWRLLSTALENLAAQAQRQAREGHFEYSSWHLTGAGNFIRVLNVPGTNDTKRRPEFDGKIFFSSVDDGPVSLYRHNAYRSDVKMHWSQRQKGEVLFEPATNTSTGVVLDPIFQSDAYGLACFLAKRYGVNFIIDIGGQAPAGFARDDSPQLVSVDLGAGTIDWRGGANNHKVVGADQTQFNSVEIEPTVLQSSLVICTGELERVSEPMALIKWLASLSRYAPAMIITASETRLPAVDFKRLLARSGLDPSFLGLTVNSSTDLEKNTGLAILDKIPIIGPQFVPDAFHPLAIVATYNDIDVAPQTISKLLNDGIDVQILDNWSSDGTYEAIQALGRVYTGLTIERFPAGGPSRYFELRRLSAKKEEIAARFPGRWILHHDSDEVRCAPWADVSLRAGLYIVERMGFNAVDFTICDFRPIDSSYSAGCDPERAFQYFEFGSRPGHFVRSNVWRQGIERIRLAESGGHQAEFPDRRLFPYKFILKHYPLRTPEQARRKIFDERKKRFLPQERAKGMHFHYDCWQRDDHFLWAKNDLFRFDETETRNTYLTELISGVGIIRS